MSWKVGRKQKLRNNQQERRRVEATGKTNRGEAGAEVMDGVLESRNQVTYRGEDELLGCVGT